jgi:hypothetical protein
MVASNLDTYRHSLLFLTSVGNSYAAKQLPLKGYRFMRIGLP